MEAILRQFMMNPILYKMVAGLAKKDKLEAVQSRLAKTHKRFETLHSR